MSQPRKFELQLALDDLKARLDEAAASGADILRSLQQWTSETAMPATAHVAKAFAVTVRDLREVGLPSLQKEVGEALAAASRREKAMEVSERALLRVLEAVRFVYGTDDPTVLEFFAPPNQHAFGYTAAQRLACHARVAEAEGRHAAELSPEVAARFAAAATAGAELSAAEALFEREAGEGSSTARDVAGLLVRFRGEVSALRRRLKAELPNPDDAYRIIPKVVRRRRTDPR